jgi:hypothetical protein
MEASNTILKYWFEGLGVRVDDDELKAEVGGLQAIAATHGLDSSEWVTWSMLRHESRSAAISNCITRDLPAVF